jgi:SAM-dependent methyltransferase
MTLPLPMPMLQRLRRATRALRFAAVRRRRPLSDGWGFDRGLPIDRYYIEAFLTRHAGDIRGRVLEVKDALYTRRFGRGVESVDVLDVDPANSAATIVADLAHADPIPDATYDAVVLTQTLQFIPDVRAAIGHVHRILRPGGVALVTVPAVSKLARQPDYWRFTPLGARELFGATFGDDIDVRAYGNVLTAAAFLAGAAREELSARDLEAHDPAFPVLVAIRAVKRS